jgi:hypothetical protein
MTSLKTYLAWREWEAYAEPVTEEGVRQAQRRHDAFVAGWKAAIDAGVVRLMYEHELNDHVHNIYHVSANIIERLKDK